MKTIKVTPNYSKRTFTIRITEPANNPNELFFIKYRTYPVTLDEFDMDLYNTNQDWLNYLKGNNYYIINKGYRKV